MVTMIITKLHFSTHDTNSLENDLPFELVIKDNIENKLNKILEFNSFQIR